MMFPNKSALVLGALMLLTGLRVSAQTFSIPVPNFSFESQTLNNGASLTNTTITNWVGAGGQATGVEDPTTTKFAAQTDNTNTGTFNNGIADGQNAAFINAGGAALPLATITSAASLTTIAINTDYVLTVAVGNAFGAGTQQPGGFSLSLLANGVPVATTGLLAGTNITDGTFADFSVALTSEAALSVVGQNLTIQLGHDNTGGNANAQIFFDNVRLSATAKSGPVPSATITSPDGKLQFIVGPDASGRLTYEVKRQGVSMVLPSPLGIQVGGVDLGTNAALTTPATSQISETYPVDGGHATATNQCWQAIIPVTGGATPTAWTLEVRVFNDGAAYRYRVAGGGTRTVNGETSQWKLPAGATLWYQGSGNTSYEATYATSLVSALATSATMMSTAVAKLADGAYVMMTEANLVNYSDMALRYNGDDTFQAYFYQNTGGWSLAGEILSPWRVTLVAPDLNTLVNTDILTNLCPAPSAELAAATWIKPGRSTWHWMVSGAPVLSNQNAFIDWTSQLGLEYYLIDDGWKNWTATGKDAWACMKDVTDYAASKNVQIWAWVHTNEVTTAAARQAYFQKAKAAGLVGLKIDFMGPGNSTWVKWYDDTLADAAAAQLMVNFHGCIKPTGRSRTWPHELTREGVSGREYGKRPGLHDAAIPFSRFVQGHADYTPTDFRSNKLGGNSYAHELAQAIVHTSPFFCYGGDPQNYLANAAVDVLKAIPSTWDETRVLPGSEVGQVAGFARRKGSVWFVGVVNNSTGRNFAVNLDFLGAGDYVIDKLADSTSSNAAWVRTRETATGATSFTPTLRADGGFVARIVPTSLLPAAPTGVTASGAAGRVQLGWTAVSGATSYSVQRATAAAGPYATLASAVSGFAYTDTNIRAGTTYYYTVSAVNAYGTGNPSASASATPPASGLPAGWSDVDIGATGATGYAAFYNGVFTSNGAGADIWAGNDAFHFTYRSWSGDGVLIARVVSLDGTDPWAKIGVMFRESLATNSKYSFTLLTPGNGVAFQLRTAAGSLNTNTTGIIAPYWVKLERVGDDFKAYSSPDGTTWTQRGATTTNAMSANLFAGLAVCSHAAGKLNTVRFDNVSFSAPLAAPASATSTAGVIGGGFLSGDIGAVTMAGGASYSNGVYTVTGAGGDVGGTADALRYTYKAITGDATIVARVVSQTSGKAGVMIRETLAASSSQVDMNLHKDDLAYMELRALTGGTSTNSGQATGAAPYWVKLTRAGNVFTGFVSPDGQGWTQVAQATVAMTANVYIGLMHSSGDASATSTFDNVSIVSLPSPWQSSDVGAVAVPGGAIAVDGAYTITGSGADIGGVADAFRYVYQTATGDCDITLRVADLPPTDAEAKAGVMIRETLNSGSIHAMLGLTPAGNVEFVRRSGTGESSVVTSAANVAAPAWVSLVRSGNTFTASYSMNGTSWAPLGTATLTMSSTVYIGLAVTSHADGTLNSAVLDDAIVTP